MKVSLIALCVTILTMNCFLYGTQSPEIAKQTISTSIKHIAALQRFQLIAKKTAQFTIAKCKAHPLYTSFCTVSLILSIAYIVSPSFRSMLKSCLGFEIRDNDSLENNSSKEQANTSIEDPIAEHIVPAQTTRQ